MVISVMPLLCETAARWLGEGRSSINDCVELEGDIAAASKQSLNTGKAVLNMGSSPLMSGAAGREASQHFPVDQKAGFLRDLLVQLHGRFICRVRLPIHPR